MTKANAPTKGGDMKKWHLKIAGLLPHWLIRACAIRLGAHATTGIYGSTEVPRLTFMDAMKRWDE